MEAMTRAQAGHGNEQPWHEALWVVCWGRGVLQGTLLHFCEKHGPRLQVRKIPEDTPTAIVEEAGGKHWKEKTVLLKITGFTYSSLTVL